MNMLLIILLLLFVSVVYSTYVPKNESYNESYNDYESEDYNMKPNLMINNNRRIMINGDNYTSCTYTSECGNGICIPYDETTNFCKCDYGYLTHNDENNACNYEQKNSHTAFMYSFFLGLGADWFYLARGNALYVLAGVVKLFTVGSGIIYLTQKEAVGLLPLLWWLTDWLRISSGTFKDGNGQELTIF